MAYKGRWLKFFETLDANKNGSIEAGDAKVLSEKAAAAGLAGPDLENLKAGVAAVIQAFIGALDANKDNKVTKEELLAGVEKSFIGKSYEAAPAWWNAFIEQSFASIDTNHSGEFSEEETIKNVTKANPSADIEKVKTAYNHVKGAGKFDLATYKKAAWTWATSANAEPELELITAFVN